MPNSISFSNRLRSSEGCLQRRTRPRSSTRPGTRRPRRIRVSQAGSRVLLSRHGVRIQPTMTSLHGLRTSTGLSPSATRSASTREMNRWQHSAMYCQPVGAVRMPGKYTWLPRQEAIHRQRPTAMQQSHPCSSPKTSTNRQQSPTTLILREFRASTEPSAHQFEEPPLHEPPAPLAIHLISGVLVSI